MSNCFTKELPRIFILTALHFIVDFFIGITVPLAEPTLTSQLSVSLFMIMIIMSSTDIVVNAIQPLSGFFLPKKGLPILLLLSPILAGTTTLIGLTDNYYLVFLLMIHSAFWVGIVHPEAVLTLQDLSKNPSFATAIFMSGGFLGFSTGCFVGGIYGQKIGIGSMWIFIIPGLLIALFVYLSNLYKYEPKVEPKDIAKCAEGKVHFLYIVGLAICVTTILCFFSRILPVYMVRKFGNEAQIWGGTALLFIGISCSVSSFLWVYLSKFFNSGFIIIFTYICGSVFIYLIKVVDNVSYIPMLCIGIGTFLGGVFPLIIAMSKNAKGGTPRLKAGLSIGGAWGAGALIIMFCSKYIDLFPETDISSIEFLMDLCGIVIFISILLSSIVIVKGRKNE